MRRAARAGRGHGAHAPGGELDPGRPQPDAAAGRRNLPVADGGRDGGEADGEGRCPWVAARERASGVGGGAVPRRRRDPRPGGVDGAGAGVVGRAVFPVLGPSNTRKPPSADDRSRCR